MPNEPESWDELSERQKRERRTRFISDMEDLVVIRLDQAARHEVAEAGRLAIDNQD